MVPCLFAAVVLGFRAALAQEINGFTIYDAALDTALAPLLNNGSIDLKVYGNTPLTIQVEVNDPDSNIRFMRMNLNDGDTVRDDGAQPYFLGGDREGDANGVSTLSSPGSFTLRATALDTTFETLAEATIAFSVLNTTIVIPEAPTSAPVSRNDFEGYRSSSMGTINGELRKWHKVTLGFQGILTSQRNIVENPFTDLRLDVTFVHPASGTSYVLPGFYACDGNAASTGATSGNVWVVHFRPEHVGTWEFTARYVMGSNIAVGDGGAGTSASYIDEAIGSLEILESDKPIPDLRAKGRLAAVGEHHLRFADGDFFLKSEVDIGDSTKAWEALQDEYNEADPTWMGGNGKGIIGVINYLSDHGMNGISVDATNFIRDENQDFLDRFDCRKTAEWDIVFSHAESTGLAFQLKPGIIEANQLSGAEDSNVRSRLYYREIIAVRKSTRISWNIVLTFVRQSFQRFGHHLALSLKLGEDEGNILDILDHLEVVDSYRSPIAVQTVRDVGESVAGSILQAYEWAGVSLLSPESAFDQTLEWIQDSDGGKKYVTIQGGLVTETSSILWLNLMAGGAGIEHSLGNLDPPPQGDLFRQSGRALDFFRSHVPFWRMKSSNSIVEGDALCLADPNLFTIIAIYLPNGGMVSLNLASEKSYVVRWFDPREGGDPQTGSVATLIAQDEPVSIGTPPYSENEAWAIVLECTDCGSGNSVALEPPNEVPLFQSPSEPPVPVGPQPAPPSAGMSLHIHSVFLFTALFWCGL